MDSFERLDETGLPDKKKEFFSKMTGKGITADGGWRMSSKASKKYAW